MPSVTLHYIKLDKLASHLILKLMMIKGFQNFKANEFDGWCRNYNLFDAVLAALNVEHRVSIDNTQTPFEVICFL